MANPVDRSARSRSRIARATLAVAFIAGVTAMIVLPRGGESPSPPAVTSQATPAFLHAPAVDPSLPSAESVFPAGGQDVEPMLPPTF